MISIASTLSGGAINDAQPGATAASLGLNSSATSNAATHKVDGMLQSSPEVNAVSIGSPVVGDAFERGETIGVAVVFHRSVDVTGTPR